MTILLRQFPLLRYKMIDQIFQFFFAFLIMLMAVSFGINYFVDVPDQVKKMLLEMQSFEYERQIQGLK